MKTVPRFSEKINKTKKEDNSSLKKLCALTNPGPQVYGFLVLLLKSESITHRQDQLFR